MSTNPDEDKTTPAQPLSDQTAADRRPADPWRDQPTQPADGSGGSGGGAGGAAGGIERTMPFSADEPTVFSGPNPNPGASQSSDSGANQGASSAAAPGATLDFGPTPAFGGSPNQGPNFGPNQSPNYGPNQSPDQNFGASQGQNFGAAPGFGPVQGPIPGADPNFGAYQGQNFGQIQGPPPNFGAGQGWAFGQGGYSPPPADPQPYYLGYQQPQPPQRPSHNGRNLALVFGAIGVVATLVVVLVVTNSHPTSTVSISTTGTPSATVTDTDTATPTDTSTDDVPPTDTDTTDDLPTISAFDPSTMADSSTDTAPFTTDALLPDSFTDSKNVEYELQAGGVETCVQKSMTSNVQGELRKYGCSQVLTGSYTVDSVPAATSDDDILISVQVFAFKDEATAKTVYADFPSNKSWDFGIWCPKTGIGANPCSANADYSDAYKSEWIGQDYRYVIEATALYTDMTSESSAASWTSSAAQKAVNSSGPVYYISTQD